MLASPYLRRRDARATMLRPPMDDRTLLVAVCMSNEGYLHEADALAHVARAPRCEEQLWDTPLKNHRIEPKQRTRFAYACFIGDVERVRFFLKRNVDVNASSGYIDEFFVDYTLHPIELAAVAGHDDVVCTLAADARVDVNCAARAAAARGLLDLIESLIERGALVDGADDDEQPPAVHWAARYARTNVVSCLLAKRPSTLCWHATVADIINATPAMIAAMSSEPLRYEFIVRLLDFAASKSDEKLHDTINPGGNIEDDDTPISCAWSSLGDFATSFAIVEQLIDASENLDTVVRGSTILWWVLENGHNEPSTLRFLPRLIQRGTNVLYTKQIRGFGTRPFEYAIRHFGVEIVRELMRPLCYVDDEDGEQRDEDVTTGLFLALHLRKEAVVRMLLSEEATLQLPSGETVLHAAAGWNAFSVEAVLNHSTERRIRLERIGANLQDQLESRFASRTPLLTSCTAGNWAGASLLVTSGARVNAAVLGSGMTAIMLVCEHDGIDYSEDDMIELIQLLVSKGALLSMRSASGDTALHFAAGHGSLSSLTALLATRPSAADIDAPAMHSDQTPLMRAAAALRCEHILALLDAGASPTLTDASEQTATCLAYSCWQGKIPRQRGLLSLRLQRSCPAAMLALHVAHQPLIAMLLLAQTYFDEAASSPESIVSAWVQAPSRLATWILRGVAQTKDHRDLAACIDTATRLIACGADLTGALNAAASVAGMSDVVQCLLDCGAVPRHRGAPPLLVSAAKTGDGSLVETILRGRNQFLCLRASIDSLDENGRSAAFHALEHAREICGSLLAGVEDGDWMRVSDDEFIALEDSGFVALIDAGATVHVGRLCVGFSASSRSIRDYFAPARAPRLHPRLLRVRMSPLKK